jgi:hypothetical protein
MDVLEGRLLLSTAPTFDGGDFYRYESGGPSIPLLREANEIAIGLTNTESEAEVLAALTADNGLVPQFVRYVGLGAKGVVLSAPLGLSDTAALATVENALEASTMPVGVAWIAPVFVNPVNQGQLVVTDDTYPITLTIWTCPSASP